MAGGAMNPLCTVDELAEFGGRALTVDGVELAVLRTPSGVQAWRNVCPHQGRSLHFGPDQFLFTPAGLLVCPHHGACFDLKTGSCTEGPCKGASLTPVALRIENGQVWLSEPLG
jgi:nitrite reductase/ring-hydroxylating ferredoxin subunit